MVDAVEEAVLAAAKHLRPDVSFHIIENAVSDGIAVFLRAVAANCRHLANPLTADDLSKLADKVRRPATPPEPGA